VTANWALRRGLTGAHALWRNVDDFAYRALLRRWLLKLRVDCVVDVGANRGWYAQSLRNLGYEGLLLCVEPIPQDAAHIRHLAKRDPEWRVAQVAAGDSERNAEFNIVRTRHDGEERTVFSSFLGSVALPFETRVETIAVRIRRLDVLLRELAPDIGMRRIFLKCDTQGFDLQVIRGAEALLPRVLLMQSEVAVEKLYPESPGYLESLREYDALGYTPVQFNVVNRTKSGTVLEFDCLMARKESRAAPW
jgi:FkbM family methyltransferase